MNGKRGCKRFKLNDRVINGKMLFATDVKVLDISLSGISLKANRRLNIGSDYILKLVGRKTIALRVTVVRCSLVKTGKTSQGEIVPIYSAGMQFKDMSVEKVAELQDFIESHKIDEVHSAISHAESKDQPKKPARPAHDNIPVISREFIEKVEYLYKWHTAMGYYKMLDIKEFATDEQIGHAYLKKTKELHPDKFPNASDDLKEKLTAICSFLNAARSTLLNPQEREKYDKMHSRRIK